MPMPITIARSHKWISYQFQFQFQLQIVCVIFQDFSGNATIMKPVKQRLSFWALTVEVLKPNLSMMTTRKHCAIGTFMRLAMSVWSLKSVCGWLFRSGLVGLLFKLNCSSRFFRVTATATVLKQVSSINSLFTVQCSVFTSLVCRLTSHQLMSWTSNMKFWTTCTGT